MTRPRISHRRRWSASRPNLICGLGLLVLASACGADDGTVPDIEPPPEQLTELSRPLDPIRAVDDDAELGTSFDEMLASATESAVVTTGGGYTCSVDHYAVGDLVVAVDELCPEHYRRAMLFGEGAQGPQSLLRVYGDFDVDGRIDGWFDPARGIALEDDDYDGRADRSRTTADHIDPSLVESFAEGWVPPTHIEEHVVEDTDHDGWYDLETLVAGQTPDGEPTYWVEE